MGNTVTQDDINDMLREIWSDYSKPYVDPRTHIDRRLLEHFREIEEDK